MKYDPVHDLRVRYPSTVLAVRGDIAPARGFWCPDEDVIVIGGHLTVAGKRATLGHEIAHMDLGDRPTAACWFATRQESDACKLAARRLVQIDDLLEVLAWTDDLGEAAAELDVTTQALRLRLDTLTQDERNAVQDQTSYRVAVA